MGKLRSLDNVGDENRVLNCHCIVSRLRRMVATHIRSSYGTWSRSQGIEVQQSEICDSKCSYNRVVRFWVNSIATKSAKGDELK